MNALTIFLALFALCVVTVVACLYYARDKVSEARLEVLRRVCMLAYDGCWLFAALSVIAAVLP